MEPTADGLAVAIASMLRLDPPPTEAEVEAALQGMAAGFRASPAVVDETRKILHAKFDIRMDLGETLVGRDEHLPWLAGRRGSIDPFYWNRYRTLLLRNGWGPRVIATLDRATDELLDLLGNPAASVSWGRRGLVMGDVQSGKTASYAALMAKAADADYRMIILLTGTLENVRRQTQERLDAALIGFDSRDFLAGPHLRQKRHIGVGLIDGRRDGVVFTSREQDFRRRAASSLGITLNAVHEPILVVTKKNKRILESLAAWLRSRNADREGKIDVPLLLIDDEADNASVNTKQKPGQTTSINAAIRDLLGLFRRSSYVGFTATPFANIFIDPETTDEMLGDDLFPRDFIHVLQPPTNYVGMNQVFGNGDLDDAGQLVGAGSTTRSIDDAGDWLPAGHQSDAEPGELPETLLKSLRSFLLTCAIRDLRFEQGRRGGGVHRTMLINVSHFTAVQNRVADAVHIELEDIRRAVRMHGAREPDGAARNSPAIAALAQTFGEEFADCGQTWAAVLAKLHDAVAPVRVQPVNASTGARSLDYTITPEPPGVRVIAVGGNSLSRGLTLEGLSTSYFLRNSRAYDTLLQMCRWFGYREDYDDLCRLWLSQEAEGWYRHITEATAELKRDFARMKRRQATPAEFGLRVRTHPDTLLITARNKMASGRDVAVSHDVSLVGRGIESARLFSDKARNEENFKHLDQFFERLVSVGGEPVPSAHGSALLWHQVPAAEVADLLDRFLVHPLNFDFQGDVIAAHLREAEQRGDAAFAKWTVALPTSGVRAAVEIPSLARSVPTRQRVVKVNRADHSLLVSGRSARVGGRADVRHGLGADQQVPGTGQEDEIREVMSAPLLIPYFFRGYERIERAGAVSEIEYRDGLILPALGLHFPGSPDPTSPRQMIRYRLNKVAQRELFESDFGDDVASEEDLGDDD